jgi:hypothetical protein
VRRALIAALVVAAASAACASVGPPPGGPTDADIPKIIAVVPDSNALNVRPTKVLVRYDDVINEQAGGGELSGLVLISPWDGTPRVEWKRTGITVRPRGPWRTNTPYTITILPGVADLRGNVVKETFVLRFSTGAAFPTTRVRGAVFDWVAYRALPKATVQLIDVKDTTLVYITASDSTGRYELTGVPAGTYVLRAIDEKTVNRELEPREPWDSTTITLTDSATATLHVVTRDTLPARITEVSLRDSVTIQIKLDHPLALTQRFDAASARVVSAADSQPLPVSMLLPAERYQARRDSLARAAAPADSAGKPAPRDSLARPRPRTIDPSVRRDTAPKAPPLEPVKPRLVTDLIIELATPVVPGTNYRVTLAGLSTLFGARGDVSRTLVVERPRPTESRDSSRAPTARDTARAPAARDTTTRRPPRQ